MTIVQRVTATVSAALVVLLTVAGLGLSASVSSGATVMTVVIAVVAAVAVALGVAAMLSFGRTLDRSFRSAAIGIGRSATELLAVASQVAAATAQTAAAANETTATVEEVRQTAMLAQEKAHEASELSERVVETSEFSVTSSRKNFAHFEQVWADMHVVAEAIEGLNEQSRSVGDIIATVNDLAEQSNLLSVNASIEAAKAGEAGKGFSVVAQEVKNLAGQSKQAVAQVQTVLSDIHKASHVVVRALEQGRETIESGRAEAASASDNAGVRLEAATRAAEATLQISATSRQQLAGMEQIGQAIVSICDAGGQLVSGTRQVEEEVAQLQELAVLLRRFVGTAHT